MHEEGEKMNKTDHTDVFKEKHYNQLVFKYIDGMNRMQNEILSKKCFSKLSHDYYHTFI